MTPRPHTTAAIACGAALLSAAFSAFSAPSAPSTQSSPHTQDCPLQSAAHSGLEQLISWQARCLQSAPYYRALAASWLARGEPDMALEAYERALLLQPQHTDTLVAYAQAFVQAGQTESAIALLQQLLQASLPSATHAQLQAQLTQLLSPPSATLQRWALDIGLRADDNLNNAPLAASFTLTLPQGNLQLPLQPESRAQAGLAQHLQLEWTGLRPQGQALWALQVQLRHRQHPSASLRYTQADTSLSWLQAPAAPRQWVLKAAHTHLQWAGQNLYRASQLSAQHQWRYSPACHSALGIEAEARQHPTAAHIDGAQHAFLASWHCTQNNANWHLQARAGQDLPQQPGRPGARQRQQELQARWQSTASTTRWSAEYQLSTQQDSAGLSPLLANNSPRRLRRHSLNLEWAAPLATLPSGWQAYAALQLSRQQSNLQPYDSARHALSLGLRRQWD